MFLKIKNFVNLEIIVFIQVRGVYQKKSLLIFTMDLTMIIILS